MKTIAELTPPEGEGFTTAQRDELDGRWLLCQPEDVDAINARLPRGVRVEAIEFQGSMYLGLDLLTDPKTYASAMDRISQLQQTTLDAAAVKESRREPVAAAELDAKAVAVSNESIR